ncbi:MAG: HD domain-containing protein, partial [Desulfobacterales bacterium]
MGKTMLDEALTQRLVEEMQTVFSDDQDMIDHNHKVLEYCRAILEAEGGDPLTVTAAALLHDIGIPEAKRRHGSARGRWQEELGPPIARQILAKLGVDDRVAEHVCRIVGSHHSGTDIDTVEFRILWDADWLVNFSWAHPEKDRDQYPVYIQKTFRTAKGR